MAIPTPSATPKPPPSIGKVIFWGIVGLLLIGGLLNNTNSPAKSTGGSTAPVTADTAFCKSMANRPYRGEVDNDVVMRYIHECRGK